MSETTHTTENRDYTVDGMTCSHRVLSVRGEVSEIPGVSAVDVELASGRIANALRLWRFLAAHGAAPAAVPATSSSRQHTRVV